MRTLVANSGDNRERQGTMSNTHSGTSASFNLLEAIRRNDALVEAPPPGLFHPMTMLPLNIGHNCNPLYSNRTPARSSDIATPAQQLC
jgi:hypothetical protein